MSSLSPVARHASQVSEAIELNPHTFLLPLITTLLQNCCHVLEVLTPCLIAGADIKEIAELGAAEAGKRRYLEDLCLGIKAVKKPILAAVEGIAVSLPYHLGLKLLQIQTCASHGLNDDAKYP